MLLLLLSCYCCCHCYVIHPLQFWLLIQFDVTAARHYFCCYVVLLLLSRSLVTLILLCLNTLMCACLHTSQYYVFPLELSYILCSIWVVGPRMTLCMSIL
ncbi:hypothetical protein RND81_02G216900 [Saponaria officinalis]|uniref:Uncharacterized protein n=1 Tax=Saponaria officinalis TaxID=3572 RepID=A0AAW1MPD1_SAPOF